MYISQRDKQAMLQDFSRLDATDTVACDRFFEKWGAGNSVNGFDRQYERFIIYESLLVEIQKTDTEKYKTVHKGTPFYFLGWLSFDLRNFEAATFYMSAALAEDRRIRPGKSFEEWTGSSAGSFMLLRQAGSAVQITMTLRERIQDAVNAFNSVNPASKLSVDTILDRFVRPMLEQGHYSIVTAFYTFVLQYYENYKNLFLTTGSVDSTEPVLGNLLKGALIFETLLKHSYPKKDDTRVTTLSSTLNTQTNFGTDFPGIALGGKSDNSLQGILQDATSQDYKTTISNTIRIRNTTGHKLLWDNIFNDSVNYKKLYQQEILAILYVISKQ